MKPRTLWRRIALLLVAALVAIQLVPVDRSNPPETMPLSPPAGVAEVFQRACNDCHSHQTAWPWYSYVAPLSWWIARHVEEGRSHLNFSTWGALHPEVQRHMAREIDKEVAKGAMPMKIYLPLHREARLSEEDVGAITGWAEELSGNETADSPPETESHD